MPAMAQLPPLDVTVRRDDLDNNKVNVKDYSTVADKFLPANFTAPDNDGNTNSFNGSFNLALRYFAAVVGDFAQTFRVLVQFVVNVGCTEMIDDGCGKSRSNAVYFRDHPFFNAVT